MKLPDRDPTLCRAFVREAKTLLADQPTVRHTWSIDDDEDHCLLDIPTHSPDGFDILIEVYPGEITVFAEGAHIHFEPTGDEAILVPSALGLLRDMLSPSMRVREECSNGRQNRWHIEAFRGGAWRTEETTGVLFYNYVGAKTERIYVNEVLTARTLPAFQRVG